MLTHAYWKNMKNIGLKQSVAYYYYKKEYMVLVMQSSEFSTELASPYLLSPGLKAPSQKGFLTDIAEYDDTMPPKRSREEILRRKREAEKTRMLKIKNNPIKLAEYKEKGE
ncbi:unnamed protein product [Callosobruchus maculatus]|uniref:Uncharacterized protein n=1 Tax=Callosobruchus maculatus TaxID=64391 RepID=A0A653CZ21_CALMS|nr:unnamed protein product [Callosobruchus maculatus]